jgi:uncharacterized protein YdaU (DUF1376 family)
MAEKLAWIAFYPKDIRSDPVWMQMGMTARGVYCSLLWLAFDLVPPGTIPTDDAAIARLLGIGGKEWAKVKAEVIPAFRLNGDRYEQKRLMQSIVDAQGRREKHSENGRKGARTRWQGDSVANGLAIAGPLAGPLAGPMATPMHGQWQPQPQPQPQEQTQPKQTREVVDGFAVGGMRPGDRATHSAVEESHVSAAMEAFDRWSQRDRRCGILDANDEHRPIVAALEKLAAGPPVLFNGSQVRGHLLIPQAVEELMRDGLRFKGASYAATAAKNRVERMAAGIGLGVKSQTAKPNRLREKYANLESELSQKNAGAGGAVARAVGEHDGRGGGGLAGNA